MKLSNFWNFAFLLGSVLLAHILQSKGLIDTNSAVTLIVFIAGIQIAILGGYARKDNFVWAYSFIGIVISSTILGLITASFWVIPFALLGIIYAFIAFWNSYEYDKYKKVKLAPAANIDTKTEMQKEYNIPLLPIKELLVGLQEKIKQYNNVENSAYISYNMLENAFMNLIHNRHDLETFKNNIAFIKVQCDSNKNLIQTGELLDTALAINEISITCKNILSYVENNNNNINYTPTT